MSNEFKGVKNAKDFMVTTVEGARQAAKKTQDISQQMSSLIALTNDTNLHEIATSMTGTFDAMTKDAMQAKFVKLFGDLANAFEAAVQTNPAHKAEYGSDIQQLQDAVASLRAVDLDIPAIPSPEGGGSYTTQDLHTVADLTADSFEALTKYLRTVQDEFAQQKPYFIDTLSTSINKIIEVTFDDYRNVSQSLTESVEGLEINATNLRALSDRFKSIGSNVGESSTTAATAKAKAVSSSQRKMEIL